jgi:hypothetical protein
VVQTFLKIKTHCCESGFDEKVQNQLLLFSKTCNFYYYFCRELDVLSTAKKSRDKMIFLTQIQLLLYTQHAYARSQLATVTTRIILENSV